MVDVELGYAQPQLPRTTMGALVALGELLDGRRNPDDASSRAEYGRTRARWRLCGGRPAAHQRVDAPEIRALLDLRRARHVPLILDRRDGAGELATRSPRPACRSSIACPVARTRPHRPRQGRGRPLAALDVPAKLVSRRRRASRSRRLAARPPVRRAHGVARRARRRRRRCARSRSRRPRCWASPSASAALREGKDADLCVLNGDPLAAGTSVLATWIDGEVVWKAHARAPRPCIEVDELTSATATILRPGSSDPRRRIAEVGERVSIRAARRVVHGARACRA
jgi:hypothetical protein